MKLRQFIPILFTLLPLASQAAPVVVNETAGNVSTTSLTLSWETGEAASPGIEVFADAGATQNITAEVKVEHQYLLADRREVGSTPTSRQTARDLRASMGQRGNFLTRLSGLQPDTTYWVRPLALDGSGSAVDSGQLVEVTTARDAAVIVESRQLVVDFSGAVALLGDLSGAVVRLSAPGSAHPLFSVVNDGFTGNRCYFDLNHLLDSTGELPLAPPSGTTLTLDLQLLGSTSINGEYLGNAVSYDGSALAARSSLAEFTPVSIELAASADGGTALLGQPVLLDLRATDSLGDPLPGFNGTLSLTSPAMSGGSVTSAPLVGGVLDDQSIILTALGNQTITITDPVSGAQTTLDLNVLEYTYENFRLHYYGNTSFPDGEASANGEGDPYTNLLEFAFGLNPLVSDTQIQFDSNGNIIRRGGPVTTLKIEADGTDFRVTFLRPKNYQSLGLNYTPEFSSNMSLWFDRDIEPTILENDGEMELVSVPYPYFTPEPSKARFFRVRVNIE